MTKMGSNGPVNMPGWVTVIVVPSGDEDQPLPTVGLIKTVKDYLVTQGIAADRISTISYGKELPLCHEENETCWARNRRVHAVVLGP